MNMERELEMEGSTAEDIVRAKARATSGEESLGSSTSSSSSSSSGPNSWTILPVVRERGEGLEEEELQDPGRSPADKHANERCNRQVTDDSPADDISDGISIISDCESTDRISPNLFLRQPLVDLGFSELPSTGPIILGSTATTSITSGVQQLEERQDFSDGCGDARQRKHKEVARSKLQEMKLSDFQVLPPLVQSGLTAIFYVVATLAILAFVGKLRNPEWQVLGNDKPLAELERRVGDLELQNNLLRAEIDIMSKQLQYLGGGGGGGSAPQEAGQRQGRAKGKTFKAWPGNGDSVQPVDITKTDLKKSFQCEDGQFVEIAAMCLENKPPHAESLADEIGDAVNDVLQQSRAFHNFERVTEKLGTLSGGNEANGAPPSHTFNPRPGAGQDREQPRRENASKERYKPRYKQEHSHERKKQQGRNTRSHEEWHSNEQRGQYRKHNDHGSRERFNKNGRKPRDNSDERDEKDNDSGSGEWHERMMQHREHARHKQAQKRNNNWYIERGDSREQMRSGEKGH